MCNMTKNNKKYFKYCLVVVKVLTVHKETCLKINGKQTVKWFDWEMKRNGSIKVKDHFKQLPVPFTICADFETVLKGVRGSDWNNTSYTEKYQKRIPYSFAYKVVCIEDKFSKPVVFYKGKKIINKSVEKILEEHDYC